MHDFDGEEIVVWGAGGTGYVLVADRPSPTPKVAAGTQRRRKEGGKRRKVVPKTKATGKPKGTRKLPTRRR